MAVYCPYCKKKAVFTSSKEVYDGRDFGMIYLCRKCGAYVGVHKGTDIPLGRLANAELRMHKQFAHAAFDPIWQEKIMPRYGAYCWLAKKMNLPIKQAHIGMFNVKQCKKVIELSNAFMTMHRSKTDGNSIDQGHKETVKVF